MTTVAHSIEPRPTGFRTRFLHPVPFHRRWYWPRVAPLSLLMSGSVLLTLTDPAGNERSADLLGFPLAITEYPLAAAKALGVLTILLRPTPSLVLFAYAGFFFDLVLALMAHVNAGDFPYGWLAVAGLATWIIAFVAERSEMRRNGLTLEYRTT